jgi:hypothetical protein
MKRKDKEKRVFWAFMAPMVGTCLIWTVVNGVMQYRLHSQAMELAMAKEETHQTNNALKRVLKSVMAPAPTIETKQQRRADNHGKR